MWEMTVVMSTLIVCGTVLYIVAMILDFHKINREQ